MNIDMTQGRPMKTMLLFAVPMILGNLLQQCYNIADTLIVGRFLGANALAAVGSSFTLMTFLTSILLGLCMGSGTLFSIRFGENVERKALSTIDFESAKADIGYKNEQRLKECIYASFILILFLAIVLNVFSFIFLNKIQVFLNVPEEVWVDMHSYLLVIFCGIFATFLYNYYASLLRAIGNSVVPLLFLALSAILNIGMDLWFVIGLKLGVAGAAWATVIAQYVTGIGIAVYSWICVPYLKIKISECRIKRGCIREIASFSMLTCIQQSVMNLGILLVQGVVNSFGPVIMAAFAAAVKIDAFAYMPVQDFGNAFSTFIAQNYGAGKDERINAGLKGAVITVLTFCIIVSAVVWLLAPRLMSLFVNASETEIIAEGVRYLHIEGTFYCGIGCLFLLYGLYRALGRPGMSVVLTVLSLGTRVVLANVLSALPAIGVVGIWWAVPIGWALADAAGFCFYYKKLK